MSVINSQKRKISPVMDKPKKTKREICPCCNMEMNICKEAEGLYYCPECDIHMKNGQIVPANEEGNFEAPLGHIKPKLAVVKPEAAPQNIDIYFKSGAKKGFRGITAHLPREGWIILTKPDGKEISIYAPNVNYLDEV